MKRDTTNTTSEASPRTSDIGKRQRKRERKKILEVYSAV